MIKPYDSKDFDSLYAFYKQETIHQSFFVLVDKDTFKTHLNHPCFLSMDEKINGLILGNIQEHTAYIDYLYGTHSSELITAFEAHVIKQGVTSIQISFRSLIKKPFYVCQNDIHVNAQGLLVNSPYQPIFLSHGYKITSYQSTYHMALEHYQLPLDLKDIMLNQSDHMIKVGFYDPTYNIKYLIDNMHNPDFANALLSNLDRLEPRPLLVGVKDHQVIGFAGPLSVLNGQGRFQGISVLPDFQGLKVGKVLFNLMCHHLKDMGATYITLFTGDDNPARFLYEQTGFVKKHTFTMLKKEL